MEGSYAVGDLFASGLSYFAIVFVVDAAVYAGDGGFIDHGGEFVEGAGGESVWYFLFVAEGEVVAELAGQYISCGAGEGGVAGGV